MILKDKINEYLAVHNKINIAIAGITCSGKTTLANDLRDYFSSKYSVTIVSQDDYFKDLHDIPRTVEGYLGDSTSAFHVEEFKNDVKMLLKNKVVIMPRYDILTNTRISKNKIVRCGQINIFEGLHTVSLISNMHLDNCITIFLDTDIDKCLRRRINRDLEQFGIPEKATISYWEHCILPESKNFILPQKYYANISIGNEDGEFYDFHGTEAFI